MGYRSQDYAPALEDDESLADYHREMDQRQAEQAAYYDAAEHYYAEENRRASLRRYGKESARRRKMFHRAHAVLSATAAVRGRVVIFSGVFFSGDPMPCGETRSGILRGLIVNVGPDHDMIWTPREGYRIVEIEPMPF